jgi:hypothetical protein
MLTRDQVLEFVKNGRPCACFDGRDFARLLDFFPVEDWRHFGFALAAGSERPAPQQKEWTREAILEQLTADLAFAFDKALGCRGISASLMYEVVKMWLWVLGDEELAEHGDYGMYGLPLLKAVAMKYELANPIGDDRGDEPKYSEDPDC